MQCVCGAGVILCIYKCVEVCGGPCTNVYSVRSVEDGGGAGVCGCVLA